MYKPQPENQARNLLERAKDVLAEANHRYLVIRRKDGTQIVKTSLTIVATIALIALITGFISWPIVTIAAIAAYVSKIKVEIEHEHE